MEYRRMTEVDQKQLSFQLSRPNRGMEGFYFRNSRSCLLLLCLSFGSALMTGCVGLVGVPSAPTVTFTASPASITVGASVTLTWTTANAVTATINNGVGAVPPSGSTTVTPAQTTTYTITAGGSGSETSTAQTTVTVLPVPVPTVTISANPVAVIAGQSSTLTVAAANSNKVVITDNVDANSYPVAATGGTQSVTPLATTTYTATATGANNQTATATATVTVNPGSLSLSVNHIIFMMQENHTFDNYFGMLNPYRIANGYSVGDDGVTYSVDGIDDKLSTSNPDDAGQNFSLFKLKSTCIDDDSSAWLQSFGDVNRYDFKVSRSIDMNGFVHTAEGYANYCAIPASKCTGGVFTDLVGQRAMGYYDQGYLNYYYYMASQFAVSDRWFSPVASESIPNRLATMTGGTTQGLVHDPGSEDHLGVQLAIQTIFQELDTNNVSWRIYYSVTDDQCKAENDGDCGNGQPVNKFPATTFSYFTYSIKYLYLKSAKRPTCVAPTIDSGPAVGDPNNAFCIDVTHIAPLSTFNSDLANGTLPSFAYIEAGYSVNDEHPGSGQSVLLGQAQMASLFNAFMASPSWGDSIFFWTYDEGGGPYDHVPPVPGHTNDKTDSQDSADYPTDISSIAVNPDSYFPCVPASGLLPTLHCDLGPNTYAKSAEPGSNPGDAAAQQGFAAQLGFRLPNMVLSPFTRRHYVSHTPMDHTAVIKLVETRFIGSGASLTARDAAQPDTLDFFDFTNIPWLIPPSGVPQPFDPSQATATCTASNM
jgi:phospholipase C